MGNKCLEWFIYIILTIALVFVFTKDVEACNEYDKITELVYFEARNQDFRGQLAVATVAMNRLYSGRWGDTICDVVDSPKQFSYMSDGLMEVMLDKNAEAEARDVADCVVKSRCSHAALDGVLHYYACKGDYSVDSPYWVKYMKLIATVGDHCYYQEV